MCVHVFSVCMEIVTRYAMMYLQLADGWSFLCPPGAIQSSATLNVYSNATQIPRLHAPEERLGVCNLIVPCMQVEACNFRLLHERGLYWRGGSTLVAYFAQA